MEFDMIKKTVKIIAMILSLVTLLSFTACDGCNDGGIEVSLKNPGEVVASTNGGGVVETENYFYYVNGTVSNTSDNTYGVPVKGAIAVMSKADMKTTEIVVPKIVSSEDNNAVIYVYGDYIYFATTTLDKTTEGKIDYEKMEFMRAKYDGSTLEKITSVQGHNTQFRIVENNDKVYIVYVEEVTEDDNTSYAIHSYDVDADTDMVVADGAAEVKLADNRFTKTITAVYTKNAVNPDDEKDLLGYNEVYTFVAGNTEGKLAFSGAKEKAGRDMALIVTSLTNGYVFMTEPATSSSTVSINYAYTFAEFVSDKAQASKERVEVFNSDKVGTSYFETLDKAYFTYTDGTTTAVVESSFVEKDKYKVVAKLIPTAYVGVKDGMLYFLDSNNALCAVELDSAKNHDLISISAGEVATTWYVPEIIGDYLFYVDSSDMGGNYYKAIDLTDIDFTQEDDNDDLVKGEKDTYYAVDEEKILPISIYNDKDIVATFEGKLVKFQGQCYDDNLKLKIRDEDGKIILDDGKISNEDFEELRDMYNDLTDEQLKLVSIDALKGYRLFIEAYDMNNVLLKLEGFNDDAKAGFVTKSASEWQPIVKSVYDKMNAYMDDYANYKEVFNLLDNNLMWEYWGSKDVEGAKDWYVSLGQ